MVDSLVQSVWLLAACGKEPHSGTPGQVCVAADGQEPNGRLPGADCVAEDGQQAHGGLPGEGSVAADDQKPLAASLDKSMWLQLSRNHMVDLAVALTASMMSLLLRPPFEFTALFCGSQ